MALLINDECINCGYCLAECPNQAIYEPGMEWTLAEGTNLRGIVRLGDGSRVKAELFHPPLSNEFHYIVPQKCSECKGAFKAPQCAAVCPNPDSFRIVKNNEKTFDLVIKQFYMNTEVSK